MILKFCIIYWSLVAVVWTRRECRTPPKVHGTTFHIGENEDPALYNGSTFPHGKTIRYRCGQGFSTSSYSGSMTECKDGTWTPMTLQCTELTCGALNPPSNGRRLDDNYNIGSYAMFACNPGYNLQGPSRLLCRVDGEWNPREPPRCIPVKCPDVSEIANGRSFQENWQRPENEYQNVIRYTCDEGYSIEGSNDREARRVCQADGTWSGSMPQCTTPRCPEIPLGNGTVTYFGDREIYTLAFFTCNTDFDLSSKENTECEKNLQWLDMPSCIIRPEPWSPRNGSADTTAKKIQQGQGYNATCNTGFLFFYTKTNNLVPNAISSLRVNNDLGVLKVRVSSNLYLSTEELECKDVRSEPWSPRNGYADTTAELVHHGKSYNATCNTGFLFFNTKTNNFVHNGVSSLRVNNDLGVLKVRVSSNLFHWTEELECKDVRSELWSPRNGYADTTAELVQHGQGYNATCNTGFLFFNTKTNNLVHNGVSSLWVDNDLGVLKGRLPSNLNLRTEELECKDVRAEPWSPRNGSAVTTAEKINHGEGYNAKCSDGFLFFNSIRTRFVSYGVSSLRVDNDLGVLKVRVPPNKYVSTKDLECKDARCEAPKVENGKLVADRRWPLTIWQSVYTDNYMKNGSQVYLKCNDGYELFNETSGLLLKPDIISIACKLTKIFLDTIPKCIIPNKCHADFGEYALVRYKNGKSVQEKEVQHGAQIHVTCNEDIRLSPNTSNLECYNGMWRESNGAFIQPPAPACRPDLCHVRDISGKLLVIRDTKVTDDVPHRTIVKVRCLENYSYADEDNYNGSVQCKDGVWEPDITCVRRSTTSATHTNSKEASTAGVITSTPAVQGTTADKRENTECTRPTIENAEITPNKDTFSHKEQIRISCEDGIRLRLNAAHVECFNGDWRAKGMAISEACRPDPCRVRDISGQLLPANDTEVTDDVPHRTKVKVRCPENYSFADEDNGNRYVRCNDGVWERNITCFRECQRPIVEHAVIEPNNDTFSHNEQITVTCIHSAELIEYDADYANYPGVLDRYDDINDKAITNMTKQFTCNNGNFDIKQKCKPAADTTDASTQTDGCQLPAVIDPKLTIYDIRNRKNMSANTQRDIQQNYSLEFNCEPDGKTFYEPRRRLFTCDKGSWVVQLRTGDKPWDFENNGSFPACRPVKCPLNCCTISSYCDRDFQCHCPKHKPCPPCEQPVCSGGCLNGGSCIASGTCKCTDGYNGTNCQQAVCSGSCLNGGSCIAPGTCKCSDGYTGKRCEQAEMDGQSSNTDPCKSIANGNITDRGKSVVCDTNHSLVFSNGMDVRLYTRGSCACDKTAGSFRCMGSNVACEPNGCPLPSNLEQGLTLFDVKEHRFISEANQYEIPHDGQLIVNCAPSGDKHHEPSNRTFACNKGSWVGKYLSDEEPWSFDKNGNFPKCRPVKCPESHCKFGGHCFQDFKCQCPPHTTGEHCEHHVCIKRCANGGSCTGPNHCTCTEGFGGSSCEIRLSAGCAKPEGNLVNLKRQFYENGENISITDRNCDSGYMPNSGDTTLACKNGQWSEKISCVAANTYFMRIVTTNQWWAGTDGKVMINLKGSAGQTGRIELQGPFESNAKREFTKKLRDVGTIQTIELGVYRVHMFDGWKPKHVVISDRQREHFYFFSHDGSEVDDTLITLTRRVCPSKFNKMAAYVTKENLSVKYDRETNSEFECILKCMERECLIAEYMKAHNFCASIFQADVKMSSFNQNSTFAYRRNCVV